MSHLTKQYLIISTFFLLLAMMLLPNGGHGWDLGCWRDWSKTIYTDGLANIYKGGTDYLPLYHYFLKAYTLFQNSLQAVETNLKYLKLFSIAFHIISGYHLLSWIKSNTDLSDKRLLFSAAVYLMNVAILYNCLIWGQVDIILTSFVFASCYFAYQHKILLSIVSYLFALNFKLHAIVFGPIIGLMLLPTMINSFTMKKAINWVITPLALQCIILLPFIYSGTIHNVYKVLIDSVGKFPVVSMNAYNVWDLLLSGDLISISNEIQYAGISYKKWGLLMFFLSSALALMPLAMKAFTSVKEKQKMNMDLSQFLIICSIIPINFFFFNTEMHERYSHPAILFLSAYAAYTQKYYLLIIGSLAYLLNLEGVLHYLELKNYKTLIFDRRFISALYFTLLIALYYQLFRSATSNSKKDITLNLQP
jgi:Gpi18-like mannosyltransferase